MSFVIKNVDFLKALQLVVPVAEKKQVKPILGNLHIVVAHHICEMTTTDSEIQIQVTMPVELAESECRMTFSAKKCFDICRTLPGDELLQISNEGEQCILQTDTSRFVLSTLSPYEYPFIERFQPNTSFELPQRPLRNIFNKCFFAMAIEDIRTFLNGLFIQISKEEIIGATTDGHRLATHKELLDPDVSKEIALNSNESVSMILPRKAVNELSKLLQEEDALVGFSVSETLLRVDFNHIVFTTNLINSRYPNYNRIIPKLGDNQCVIDKEVFKQALLRTAVLCADKLMGARFIFEAGQLTLIAHNVEQEEAKNVIPIDFSGEKINTAFNIGYLMDVLNVVEDSSIRVSFAMSNSGIVIEELSNDRSLFVIMVMKV